VKILFDDEKRLVVLLEDRAHDAPDPAIAADNGMSIEARRNDSVGLLRGGRTAPISAAPRAVTR